MGRMSLLFFASIIVSIGVGVLLWWKDDANCKHDGGRAERSSRWIEVDEKKNRPPLMLLEVVSECQKCRKIIKSWYTEDQCQKYGIRTPPSAS